MKLKIHTFLQILRNLLSPYFIFAENSVLLDLRAFIIWGDDIIFYISAWAYHEVST